MVIGTVWWLVALGFLLVGAGILAVGNRQLRQEIDLPNGRIVYQDSRHHEAQTLVSERFGIVGKPDYLIERGRTLIPVELKSRLAPNRPYQSHIMQVATYCLLVEEVYGVRPTHGIIRYDDHLFEIEYTDQLETAVIKTVAAMRHDMLVGSAERNHNHRGKCDGCGVRDHCAMRL